MFEELHGSATLGDFATRLRHAATTNFGSASQAFLERLVADRQRRPEWLSKNLNREMDVYRKALGADGLSNTDREVCDHFAVVYAALRLATHYGILPWTVDETGRAVRACERAHRDLAAKGRNRIDPIAAVASYINRHFNELRIIPCPGLTESEIMTAPGFVKMHPNGWDHEFLILPKVLKQMFPGQEKDRVLEALDDAGLLHRDASRPVTKRQLIEHGDRSWVYAIDGLIMESWKPNSTTS